MVENYKDNRIGIRKRRGPVCRQNKERKQTYKLSRTSLDKPLCELPLGVFKELYILANR